MALVVSELVSPKTVKRNAGLTAAPPAAAASRIYQRPKNDWPTRDELPGISRLAEPKPWPAPLPDRVRLMRANEAVAGIVDVAPGSVVSITSTAGAPPRALETPTLKLVLPTSGGSHATACGTLPPVPCVPVPVIT